MTKYGIKQPEYETDEQKICKVIRIRENRKSCGTEHWRHKAENGIVERRRKGGKK